MTSRFEVHDLPLAGLKLLRRQPIGDDRGHFERLFCANELATLIHGKSIVQVNHTLTRTRGAVRGMHFQHPPFAETKFVSCLRGAVFDVAVDLRRGSATFLRWHGEELTADNHHTVHIPEGFAHGFQTLSDECELLYFHTAPHTPNAEGRLNAEDPRLGIRWPLPITHRSARDESCAYLAADFSGLTP